eukprot:g120.t1
MSLAGGDLLASGLEQQLQEQRRRSAMVIEKPKIVFDPKSMKTDDEEHHVEERMSREVAVPRMQEALAEGNAHQVFMIISGGVMNVDEYLPDGTTALMQACRRGYLEIAENLCLNGCNKNLHDKALGFTALHFAAAFNRGEVVEMLVKRNEWVDPNPLELNRVTEAGLTPLMVAASNGSAEVAGHLIKAGVLLDETDEGGFTAVMFAHHFKHRDVVEMLIEAGAHGELDLDPTT